MVSGPAGLTMYPQFLCNWRVPSPAEVVQDLIPSPTYISVPRLFRIPNGFLTLPNLERGSRSEEPNTSAEATISRGTRWLVLPLPIGLLKLTSLFRFVESMELRDPDSGGLKMLAQTTAYSSPPLPLSLT